MLLNRVIAHKKMFKAPSALVFVPCAKRSDGVREAHGALHTYRRIKKVKMSKDGSNRKYGCPLPAFSGVRHHLLYLI